MILACRDMGLDPSATEEGGPPPSAVRGAALTRGGEVARVDAQAGVWASFSPSNGALRRNVSLTYVRATAVGGMRAYGASIAHQAEMANAMLTSSLQHGGGASDSHGRRLSGAAETTAECAPEARALMTTVLGSAPSDAQLDSAFVGASAALHLYGGSLASLCCPMQAALIAFTAAASFPTVQTFPRLLTAAALSDWAEAATQLNGRWCRANAAVCPQLREAMSAGCTEEGYWMLADGFLPDMARDHGVAQRFLPPHDVCARGQSSHGMPTHALH